MYRFPQSVSWIGLVLLSKRGIPTLFSTFLIMALSAGWDIYRFSAAFEKLLSLGYRLLAVIKKNEGIPNKDLERFSRDIQSLCDKWDR